MSQSAEHRTVVVDPRFNPHYHAWFIEGFHRIGFDVVVDGRAFPRHTGFPRPGLRVLLIEGGVERAVFVAADDKVEVDLDALAWADVYGAVNVRLANFPPDAHGKVVPLGPSFGIRRWSRREATQLGVRTLRRSLEVRSPRKHVELWRSHLRRSPLEAYVPGPSDPGYVFFTGWLWQKHPEVNPPRARFVRACRDVAGVRVEGGFPPRPRGDVDGYADVTAPGRYSLDAYLEKTARSAVAFASPAVHGCLGWKLGEFLALGKAVVMTPYDRDLPAPLENGVHVHAVEDDHDAIVEAVTRLCTDHAYRQSLERAARAWFDRWATPEAMARRLLADPGRTDGQR